MLAVHRAPVPDGENDRVALVALHALEVLDEQRFFAVLGPDRRKRGIGHGGEPERFGDALSVRYAEGDDAQRLVRSVDRVLDHQLRFRRSVERNQDVGEARTPLGL